MHSCWSLFLSLLIEFSLNSIWQIDPIELIRQNSIETRHSGIFKSSLKYISNDSYITMHQYITIHSKVSICSLKRICQIELNELIELIELI